MSEDQYSYDDAFEEAPPLPHDWRGRQSREAAAEAEEAAAVAVKARLLRHLHGRLLA